MSSSVDARLVNQCVEGCAESHQRLLAVVDELADELFDEPSRLPGWTRGHVVAHLAMNALSHVRLFEHAAAGEQGEQYPGGPPAREAQINEAAAWNRTTLRHELRRAIYGLEGAWAGATAAAWLGTGLSASGSVLAVADLPFLRWRETVVHLTDLDAGVESDSWPGLYVRLELERQKMAWAASRPMGLTLLPAKAQELPEHRRVAWLLGRLEVEGLGKGPGL